MGRLRINIRIADHALQYQPKGPDWYFQDVQLMDRDRPIVQRGTFQFIKEVFEREWIVKEWIRVPDWKEKYIELVP